MKFSQKNLIWAGGVTAFFVVSYFIYKAVTKPKVEEKKEIDTEAQKALRLKAQRGY